MSYLNRTYPAFILFLSLVLFFGCAHPSIPVQGDGNGASGASLQAEAQQQPPLGNTSVDEGAAPSVARTPETTDIALAELLHPAQNSNTGSSGNGSKKDNNDDEQALLDTALDLTQTAQEYWADGETDQAIEALDQAYGCILKVPGNKPEVVQQKEELRFVISKRLIEMYASRQTTVRGTSAAIPMVLNDHVEREIRSFQTIERDFFLESYKRSGRYRKDMVAALKAAGLPEELSWLPLIESGFKVRALSRSRAFGLWQFIPSTGYKFGLKRNAWIDERLDPAKSTDAAIAYFNELHQMFGDWATVLAAYNCGEGSVARVIRNQKVEYLDNFWDFYERLPRETARYFPRFLAVLAIVKEPAKYGFTLPEPDAPLSYETVTIERPVHLRTLAEKVGIDHEYLISLNPELRNGATPNTSYALRVPPGAGEAVVASLDKLPKWSPPKVEFVMHRVRRGETLSIIALRYRTSIQKIVEANNMRSGKTLRVGQKLKIPVRNSTT